MGPTALLLLPAGALAIGLLGWYAMQSLVPIGWLWTTIAALVGGYIGSQLLKPATAHGPEVDGFHVLPAFVGAVLLSAALEFIFRSVGYEGRRMRQEGRRGESNGGPHAETPSGSPGVH